MQAKLVLVKQDGRRREINLAKPTTILGRRKDCDIQIPLSGVSRRHCEVTVKGSVIRVKDLGSSNGTYVNNRRISEQALSHGDRLRVGTVMFTLQVDGKQAPAPAEQPAAEPSIIEVEAGAGPMTDMDDSAIDAPMELELDAILGGVQDSDSPLDALSALQSLADDSDEKDESKA